MLPILLTTTDSQKAETYIQKFIEERTIAPYHVYIFEPEGKEFSITQVREIKKLIRFTNTNKQLFILKNFSSASLEAQNALLKTLEEHQTDSYFILIVTSVHAVLPTIVSRSKVIALDLQDNKNITSTSVSKEIDLLISGDITRIGSTAFYVKKSDNPLVLIDAIADTFHKKLITDANASKVLKDIVVRRYGVEHNNVDAQNAIDSILLSIYSRYRP